MQPGSSAQTPPARRGGLAADGERHVVEGVTRHPQDEHDTVNLWVVRLTPDGRASSFTEWYKKSPRP